MKPLLLFIGGLFLIAAAAPAQAQLQLNRQQQLQPRSGTSYDWQTGNRYTYDRDTQGNTTVRGSNLQTGSMWRTEIERDGDMRGTDSKGNMWRYDDSSGFYQNYGTGKMCVGKGAARTCY